METGVVNRLVLVSNGDDWEALYVNGKKVFANHRIPVEEIIKWSLHLEVPLEKRFTTKEYTEKCYNEGDFDDNLEDVQLTPG